MRGPAATKPWRSRNPATPMDRCKLSLEPRKENIKKQGVKWAASWRQSGSRHRGLNSVPEGLVLTRMPLAGLYCRSK